MTRIMVQLWHPNFNGRVQQYVKNNIPPTFEMFTYIAILFKYCFIMHVHSRKKKLHENFRNLTFFILCINAYSLHKLLCSFITLCIRAYPLHNSYHILDMLFCMSVLSHLPTAQKSLYVMLVFSRLPIAQWAYWRVITHCHLVMKHPIGYLKSVCTSRYETTAFSINEYKLVFFLQWHSKTLFSHDACL